MKNKGLLISLIALFLVLTIGFGYGLGRTQTASLDVKEKKEKILTIGILQFISHPSLDQIKKGIVEGLEKEGYKEGKNIRINYLNGQGDQSKLQTMSQQLINEGADILIPIATPAAKAMANETKTIPIIASGISDPVGAGLVKDLEKPEGNITGVKTQAPVEDQVALLNKLLPNAKKIGVLYSSGEENSKSYVKMIKEFSEKKGYEVKPYAVQSSNDLSNMIQVMDQEVDVLYIPQDNGVASAFQTVVSEANKDKKPIFVSVDNMVLQGGLATVGQNQYDLGIRTAKLAVETIKNAGSQALPFDVVSTGEAIVNEKVANELGITISEELKKSVSLVGGK